MAEIERGDGFETLAIHAGQEPDPLTGAVVPPIYQVSTYKQDGVGGVRGGTRSGVSEGAGRWVEGYEYSRTANPTRGALEECLAALEGGVRALAFASGMAAEDCLIRTACRPGDHVLISRDAYGGTYRLFDKVHAHWGITYHPVPVSDADAVRTAVAEVKPVLIWVETPTNPLLRLVDIEALAAFTKPRGIWLAVDSTFATPYFQNPLALGADIVMHSTTKYLGGHSDLVGGVLMMDDESLFSRLSLLSRIAGAIPGPFDCWLTLRGVKTLAARMREHERSAMAIARFLEEHPKVLRVHFPGLPSHPQYALAKRQMRGFGGMVAVEVRGGAEAATRVLESVKLFALTGSLGGVESIISYPPLMSHAALSPEERHRRGVVDGLVRLSVGLEDVADLIADLDQALGQIV